MMSTFNIQFTQPLTNVATERSRVDLRVQSNPADTSSLTQEQLAVQSQLGQLTSEISQTLQRMEAKLIDQDRRVISSAIEFSTLILRELLQQDDELLEKRILRQLELALESPNVDASQVLFVSPAQATLVANWLAENNVPLQLETDSFMQPGDFRIELNERGLASDLDSQLRLIADRLGQQTGGEA